MLLQVMREVRNFFEVSSESGEFTIDSGAIELKGTYLIGQHILITGSILNDGVYLLEDNVYTLQNSSDEVFGGTVYGLRIPSDFISLCEEIQVYVQNAAGKPSAYTNESVLGVHSWTKATDKNGAPAGWQMIFAARLAMYRKMFTEVWV